MAQTPTLSAAGPRPAVAGGWIDWPAVLGGATVATAIAGLFTTFGAALGLSTLSVRPGAGGFDLWLAVTALWIVVTLVASYLAGGYVAGRMRRRLDATDADEAATCDGINGLVVWGLGMVVTGWMAAGAIGGATSAALGAAGSLAGGVAEVAGSAIGGVAQAAGAQEDAGAQVLGYISDMLMRPVLPGARAAGDATSGLAVADAAELTRQSASILGEVLRTGEIADEDRAFLTAAAAAQAGLTPAEAEARVASAVAAVQAARNEAIRLAAEAEKTAAEAAETARIGAILTAFLLTAAALVAAVAAVAGGVRGGRDRDDGRLYGGFSYRLRS